VFEEGLEHTGDRGAISEQFSVKLVDLGLTQAFMFQVFAVKIKIFQAIF
jgi:hypothetical protein